MTNASVLRTQNAGDFIGLRKAADLVGLSARTLRRAVLRGKISGFRPNGGRGVILVRYRDVLTWIERGRIDNGPSRRRR